MSIFRPFVICFLHRVVAHGDNQGFIEMTSDAPGTPPAEINIDLSLVERLLKAQFPDLADLPVKIMEAGWDNVMVRVGERFALRLPRRFLADNLLRNEQVWLPTLAPHLPLPIPAPLRCGTPTDFYPFHWSVLPWLPGQAADLCPPDADQAVVLAAFLKTLHGLPLPENAPANPHRDCPLTGKQPSTEQRMRALEVQTDLLTPEIMAMWQAGLSAPIDLTRCWIAGDIHARNVLVDDGKLSAMIDWGDMCAGDPASDLASIWALFAAADARRAAIEAYDMSAATLARAKGWAVFYGVILLETGLQDTPRHAEMGRKTLARLAEDS
jgi:aminoglycoside phosphotransferase (APT) family kinase protein